MNDNEKIFEDLYYKENAKVSLLEKQINYLKAEIDYLKSKDAFTTKYKANNERD